MKTMKTFGRNNSTGIGESARLVRSRRRPYQTFLVALTCAAAILLARGLNAQEYTFTTLVGAHESPGAIDGPASVARFGFPSGVAVDRAGNVYVADTAHNGEDGSEDNYTMRKVTPDGVVTTLAGLAGRGGSADGTGSGARFHNTSGVAVDSEGNLYVTDCLCITGGGVQGTIRKVTPAGVVTTLAGLAGTQGTNDGTGSAARFNTPFAVAVDTAGSVHVADRGNFTIRKVSPGGVVTTLAGSAGLSGSDDGLGRAARFSFPSGVTVDNSGNVFVADAGPAP